ncbi:hypothetical protein V6N00_13230 [Tersicoccus sp. MR15.9]|uniref:hypothetical protein n=1 Tax=Tersicoccus mangrovi TaxID=3121635 RepID=UPI002FE69982
MAITARARVQRGVPEGGEFAATSHGEPTISLSAPTTRQAADATRYAVDQHRQLEAIAQANSTRIGVMAAQGLAASIRGRHPEATTITFTAPDDDRHEYALEGVQDADGNELDVEFETDEIELGYQVRRCLGEADFIDSDYNHELDRNVATVDIDAALAYRPEQQTAAERGEDIVTAYAATQYGVHEEVDDRIIVRDLLTDLHHWSDREGVDLNERNEAAGKVAWEETELANWSDD